jgi:hypothetical protein
MELGDPLNTHTYELCVYDGSGLVASATAPSGVTWQPAGSGFRYRDPTGLPDGLGKILLKAGADDKAKIIVRGKGENLAIPDLTMLTSPLTVQLKRSGSDVCWGATYTFPPAIRNDAAQFKDRAD